MSGSSGNSSWNKFRKLRFSKNSLDSSIKGIEKKTVRHAKRFVSSRLDRLFVIKRTVAGWVALVFILAGISTLQWMVFRESYTTLAPAEGGTYSEGVLGPLETLNPIYARTAAEKSSARLLFAGLYNYDETGNLKGDLAESLSVNETETKYTVKLKQGAKWSDGAAISAQDVVFTVDLLRNPNTGAAIPGWNSFKAEAPDARTVVFTLPGAYASFVHSLTFPILPRHALAGVKPAELREQPFSESPITSGPFALRMLQSTSSDGSRKIAHLVSNPNYIHGKPRLERFQLNSYPTRKDIEVALRTNEIMATPEMIHEELPDSIKKMYDSRSYSINDGVFAIFNTRDGITASETVRKALSLAINIEELRDNLARPTEPLSGPILKSQVVDELPSMAPSDVDAAKKILEDDGWIVSDGLRKKEGQPLALRMVALQGDNFTQTAEELAKIWRKELNVKIDIEIVDPLDTSSSVLQTILQPRNFDILVYELVLRSDPDVYAYWHSSQSTQNGLNFASYSNNIADEALSSGRARIDGKYRSNRYQSFVRRWLADMPALPLYQPKIDYINSKTGTSLDDDATLIYPEDRFANVIYWSVSKESVYKTP